MLEMIRLRFKVFLGERTVLFWSVLFPIILVTFFSFAFGGFEKDHEFSSISIAVVKENTSQELVEGLSNLKVDHQAMFEVTIIKESELSEALTKSYVGIVDGETIHTTKTSIKQTILVNVVNQYLQVSEAIKQGVQIEPQLDYTQIDFNQTFVKNIPLNETIKNSLIVSYYSVIAMAVMYGAFWGIGSAYSIQGNLSYEGARFQVSPYSKMKQFLIDITCCWTLLYIGQLIIISYMKFVIGIQFADIPMILVIVAVGSLFATLLGYFFGLAFKMSMSEKNNWVVAITMVGSFLAGMMSPDIKYSVDQTFPIINQLNPVALITDSMMSLNVYGTRDIAITNMMTVAIMGAVLTVITLISLRRNQYDSI